MADKIDDKDKKDSVALIDGLREAYEKSDAEGKEFEAKAIKRFDELEDKNQELVKKQLEQEKVALEAKEAEETGIKRIDELEAKILRFNAGGNEGEIKAEIKALESFITKGRADLSPEEIKYLRTDSDVEGAVLAPSEYVSEIIKDITEISPIRGIARVRRTSSKSIEVPKRTSLPSGAWTGEGETKTDSNANYGMIEISVNKNSAVSIVTTEMLADAAFNMDTEMNADIVETFGQMEGAAFVLGNGVKKPTGFMVNSDIQVVSSGIANAINAVTLVEMTAELKDGYNGVYVMNRRTLGKIRTLEDGQGDFLWQNGIKDGLPNTINGDRYVSAIDMADIAANALPVAYGDFSRGYTIVDGVQLSFVRDIYTLADAGKVRIVAHRRVGGEVTQPEAIKHYKLEV